MVVSNGLVGVDEHGVALADVDVHSSERDWFYLDPVKLYDLNRVVVDGEPMLWLMRRSL